MGGIASAVPVCFLQAYRNVHTSIVPVPSSAPPKSLLTLSSRLALAGLLLTMSAATAVAQSLAVGRFEGDVRTRDGRVVRDAEVRAEDRLGRAVHGTVVGSDGRFRFDALPAGRYDVTVEALGYRPVVHLDVRVGAGFNAHLTTVLSAATPPVTTRDTIPHRGDARNIGQWMLDRGYADLPSARRIGGDLAAFAVGADAFGVEGLPWRMTSMLVDGAVASSPAAPAGSGAEAAALALPVRAVSSALVGGLGYDAEVGGSGIGLQATTRRGARRTGSQVIGEGGSAAMGGAYVLSGPLHGDTAQGVLGFDYQRNEREFWSESRAPDPRVDERVSAFGRLDWRGGERLAITARASAGSMESRGFGERSGPASFYGSDYRAVAGQGSINAFALLGTRAATELRVAADVSRSEGRAGDQPRGFNVGDLSRYGGAMGTPHRELRAAPRVTGLLHIDAGAHRFKVGATVAGQRLESDYVRDADGVFAFDGAPSALGLSVWRRVESEDVGTVLRLRESALVLQDDWRVVPGLSVTMGLRLDRFDVPVERIEANAEWSAASGLDTRAAAPRTAFTSPRIGFRWELGRDAEWLLEGGAGVFRAMPDVRDLAEALILDRSADVRYGLVATPTSMAPSANDLPVVGQTLSMLAPDFGGTRTQRLSLGLPRRLGDWSASVSGVYRLTEGLSRRRDVNLPFFASGVDQFGGRLYGRPLQLGAALPVAPGSNRRFSAFDAVHVLEGSGRSEFWGVTAGVERVRERGLSATAFYTFSQATDNLPQLGRGLPAFPDGLAGSDWSDGRSDLDVPHRALVALEWRPNERVSLAGIYRLRSGFAFTPGFRDGVDANADGDWTNDAAFVDAALPGMAALLDEHKCLTGGAYAERNSCRGPLAHSLDLRLTLQVARLRAGRLDLVLDAVDLLALNSAPIDAALLLVDAAGTVQVDPATGVTTIPYLVNPGFGEAVRGRTPGVLWRVGLRVTP